MAEHDPIKQVDVVVIGGGHAGIEAALASARMGVHTALVTLDSTKIGQMSCNPSIGGLGKGQLVREVDALGGEMGKAADSTALQIKMLNTRKGPAVQSLRSQNDRVAYRRYMQQVVRHELFIKQNVLMCCGRTVKTDAFFSVYTFPSENSDAKVY